MKDSNSITIPSKKEKRTLRLMIVIGLLSFGNFLYWFFRPELVESPILFKILAAVILFDTLRVVYIWYHYWSISVPQKPKTQKQFTVDVLTTYFPGEPYDMITETLLAIKQMRYPHQTYLCDEANDPFLIKFCKEHGIIHVTRNNRINAKAGNINNALKQAEGEICLILDPDHVPKPDFLEEILPYFEDDDIGFVQTPQVYYNVYESYVAEGASQQTFHFYGPMMMCMNAYGTVNAIGANCVFRRKALDSIGGHAPGLSEDMHTAMQLHAKGWKSLYVPKVFTEGLTPASLTAYYKQQLKWSRGTLELLVSVYPKLFKNFTWRQKLHYGILPFHYLSGIFILLGFLVPIVSLFNTSLPWRGNIINFALIYTPVLVAILCIRLYVQRWVMNKSERGIHLLGGLLIICTWWVFIIGFVYTIIRKKVPYLPTPKNDKELTNYKILIPNLVIAAVSLAAVIYGLNKDLTPFTLFMSGFALLNVFFMLFTLVFAYQQPKDVKLNMADKIYTKIYRNRIFKTFNKVVLPIIIFSVITCGSIQYYSDYVKWGGVSPEKKPKNHINYLGVFSPKVDNGLTDLQEVKNTARFVDHKFDLISLYLSWNKELESNFPDRLVDSIYKQNSIPVITWEPWINTFQDSLTENNNHVYNLIETGYFDNYIARFAKKLKELNNPVFLRFAHEFDNPFYPWYMDSESAPEKFKTAWVHAYEIFKQQGADNVVWIWNPLMPDNMAEYYPGKSYVDWIGVNILNYGTLNKDGKPHGFKELYQPFHEEIKKLPPTPVVISELGSLKEVAGASKSNWLDQAFLSIENDFDEIKSVIYFNSKVDDNWPTGERANEYLDWSIESKQTTTNLFAHRNVPDYIHEPLPQIADKATPLKTNLLPKNIKGVNLKIGHNWEKDYHILNRRKLVSDFKRLKKLNINTIKYQGNSIYSHNVFSVSKEFNIKIAYSFWIPEHIDFMLDTEKANALKSDILKSIKSNKNNNQIVSWHIENDVQYQQKNFYHKPELLYQNRAYLIWLKDLVNAVKAIDSSRPIVVDVEINRQSIYHIKNIRKSVKSIDGIGLIANEEKRFNENLNETTRFLKNFKIPYLISSIDADILKEHDVINNNNSFYITAWQDKHESNKLVFDGLIDRKGRPKSDYWEAQQTLASPSQKIDLPKIRILKPSKLIYPSNTHTFHSLIYNEETGWLFGSDQNHVTFEWSLIKCDEFGNYLAIKEVGYNANLVLKIPDNYEFYRLHLTMIKDGYTVFTVTPLNTPL